VRVTDPNAGSSGSPDGDEWRQAGDEALAVLGAALLWDLPSSVWEQAREALAGVAAAITAGSADALWQASEYLDFYSPLRTRTRLGDLPERAPKAVREQIAELVDALALTIDLRSGSGSTTG
jgi:hypothetical protein